MWTVASLWRYPVKSMAGEELRSSEATDRGLLGDRSFGVIDRETGKLASAKRPRLWANLLGFSANFVEEPRQSESLPVVRIILPDATAVRSDDPALNATLSRAVGRPVVLASNAPDGAVFDEDWRRDSKGEPTKRAMEVESGETIVEWPAPVEWCSPWDVLRLVSDPRGDDSNTRSPGACHPASAIRRSSVPAQHRRPDGRSRGVRGGLVARSSSGYRP